MPLKDPIKLYSDEELNDSDKVLTVPAGKLWRVLWIHIELVTTATVGNRTVVVNFRDDSDDVIAELQAGAAVAGSATQFIEVLPGIAPVAAAVGGKLYMGIPQDSILPAGYDIRIWDSAGVDAAADDMVIQMMVEEITP